MKQRVILLLSFLLFCGATHAQRIKVSGTILDQKQQPLVGVTVVDAESNRGTISSLDGTYSIDVDSEDATLNFAYIGMLGQNIKVGSKTVIDVTLVEDVQSLEEVLVVGYGTVRRKEMTGASVQVKAEDMENSVTPDLGLALQGMVPGVSVTASSGDPGAASNIQIRGVTSLTGDNTPLYVVDGIPQNGDPLLSPSEIAQIDILKDAASCAIYGSRGAAGVILITTKQGETGQMKIKFNAMYGVQQIQTSRLPSLMNTEQQAYFTVACNSIDGYGELDGTTVLKNSTYYLNDSNIFDTIIENNAPVKSYNLTLSGRSVRKKYNYIFSG